MSEEIPLAACDAIKMAMKQTGKGIILTLSLNPEDVTDALNRVPIGEVIKIYVTKPDIGV